jgi:hypothetical protein
VFAAWKQGRPASLTCTFSGAELDALIHFLLGRTEVRLPEAAEEVQHGVYPTQVCFNFFFFAHGALLAHTLTPLGISDRVVLERFAQVFDLTYRRFLELKEAEARRLTIFRASNMLVPSNSGTLFLIISTRTTGFRNLVLRPVTTSWPPNVSIAGM